MVFDQSYACCGDDAQVDETPAGGTPAVEEVSCELFPSNCYTNYHSM